MRRSSLLPDQRAGGDLSRKPASARSLGSRSVRSARPADRDADQIEKDIIAPLGDARALLALAGVP